MSLSRSSSDECAAGDKPAAAQTVLWWCEHCGERVYPDTIVLVRRRDQQMTSCTACSPPEP
jgi:GH24 family phage-related lysozyme (muramidase)